MANRRQRMAISQAEIRKRNQRWKEFIEGRKAFQQGIPLGDNPYTPDKMDKYQTWINGWFMARLNIEEKENE